MSSPVRSSTLFAHNIANVVPSAQNYTAWGYQDCQFDTSDGSYGGMLTKLLLRHLPEYFPVGSAYAHFPFIVPSRIQQTMQDRVDPDYGLYTWARPVPLLRPSASCVSKSVSVTGGKTSDAQLVCSPQSLAGYLGSDDVIIDEPVSEQ